jgi:hypothetical protein
MLIKNRKKEIEIRIIYQKIAKDVIIPYKIMGIAVSNVVFLHIVQIVLLNCIIV